MRQLFYHHPLTCAISSNYFSLVQLPPSCCPTPCSLFLFQWHTQSLTFFFEFACLRLIAVLRPLLPLLPLVLLLLLLSVSAPTIKALSHLLKPSVRLVAPPSAQGVLEVSRPWVRVTKEYDFFLFRLYPRRGSAAPRVHAE